MTLVFRHDINALRALAVCLVVLFHFDVPGFSGGFIGVDIFFVLSGYLMTRIIVGRMDNKRFSILAFYADRVRRIVPALTFLCASLLMFGLIFVDPLSLRTLGQHVFSAMTFWSNMEYMLTSGYFDASSNAKWLLHTWSLSVEAQFYLIYPLGFWLLARWAVAWRALLPILIGLAGLSLACAVVLVEVRPTAAFYLLPSRAWEMLLGGIVAAGERRWSLRAAYRRALNISGLTLIVAGFITIVPATPWPSYSALLPTMGTALVLAAGAAGGPLVENSIVAALGRWSYSLYLWHWPLVVGLVYFEVPLSPFVVLPAIAATVAMGAFSYRFFERWPQTMLARNGKQPGYAALGMLVVLVAAAGGATVSGDGWPYRHGTEQQYAVLQAAQSDWAFPNDRCGFVRSSGQIRPCVLGAAESGGTAVLGDSHAQQWYGRVASAGLGADDRVVFFTRGGCPPVPGINTAVSPACSQSFRVMLDAIRLGGFDQVVLAANWSAYFTQAGRSSGLCFDSVDQCSSGGEEGYRGYVANAFAELEMVVRGLAGGPRIVFLLDNPVPGFDVPVRLAKRAFNPPVFGVLPLDLNRAEVEAAREFADELVRDTARRLGAEVVDPMAFVCDATLCATQDSGIPRYWDGSHLTTRAVSSSAYSFMDDYWFGGTSRP